MTLSNVSVDLLYFFSMSTISTAMLNTPTAKKCKNVAFALRCVRCRCNYKTQQKM